MQTQAGRYFFGWFLFIIGSCELRAQPQELTSLEIINLIPNKVKGFTQEDDFKSKQIKIGTITYSITEKKFVAVKQSIKILLFDFTNASIMYEQALRDWKRNPTVESDTLIYRYVSMENCRGWESYSQRSHAAQIFLGICDRFFLALTGENVSLDQLRQVVRAMQIEEFPKSR
jgi:hypothetical protein